MCFRPADVDQIEHRCPECGTNNLPEATMCARCFAPMEPLTAEDIAKQKAQGAPSPTAAKPPAPGAPPSAPGAPPSAPSAPSAPPSAPKDAPSVTFGSPSANPFGQDDDNAVYF